MVNFDEQFLMCFSSELIDDEMLASSHIEEIKQAIFASEFVFRTLQSQPELLQAWLITPPDWQHLPDYLKTLTDLLQPVTDEVMFYRVLRQFRHRELARLSYLQTHYPEQIEAIFTRLSELAESIILAAKAWLFEQLCQSYGTPMNDNGEVQELIVLGMGKLGGKELNFSSDIDLIFTYPEQGETVGGRKAVENRQFFTKLGQRLILALDQVTAEGIVYRVDMRLRPFGESGALVLSFNALEEYYQTQGRDWERYAMIKARILGEQKGNLNHRYLNQLLRPFVYRRYLDFSAIQSLREMKQKINREVLRRALTDNIKLGAGGIREVEFIVQTFQLMRGGRDKRLQTPSLLVALPHLCELNLLTKTQVCLLREAYLFLRDVENVLQAIDDKQTQQLPTESKAQQILMRKRYSTWEDFMTALQQHQQVVRTIFNELIGCDEEGVREFENEKAEYWKILCQEHFSPEELAFQLANYAVEVTDNNEIYHTLNDYLEAWRKRPIGTRGRSVLLKLLPRVLDLIFVQPDYAIVLPRILTILDKIVLRTTYLELLLEKPPILPQLIKFCSLSPVIAEQIARYPLLLDELIVPKKSPKQMGAQDYISELNAYLLRIPADDEEAMIDGLRQFKQSHLLNIAAADLLGELPLMKISDHLTYLAEAIIDAVVNFAWKSLFARFGQPAHLSENEKDFVVVGYGKLGGIELGYHSDLDLVFLHNAPENGETVGGKKSISSYQFYLKLAQKINSLFSLNTSVGQLYEVDMRLRPSGEAGLLVSSFSAYEFYQKNEAWTWEIQALVRARAVYGKANLREKFEQIRCETLTRSRKSVQLSAEICKMREKMWLQYTMQERQFHLKLDRGGITDIEFIAQFLVLNYGARFPKIVKWSDNVRIFEHCVECGILSEKQGNALIQAYLCLRDQIHHLNLRNLPIVVDSQQFLKEREIVRTLWQTLVVSASLSEIEQGA